MASFRFRLERVLAWRRTALALEQARLENLKAQLRAVETARRELIEDRLRREREIATSASVTGHELAMLDVFRAWASREEAALAARAADLHRAASAQAARVVSADRDARLVERLREKRLEAWTAEELRALEETAAESGVAQWRRAHGAARAAALTRPDKTTSDVR